MHARRFGPAGPEVPVIGIGTWNMELDDRGAAIAAIRRALDLGMVHVDTAELYGAGKVERMVGEAIAGRRDQVFLVSKVLPRHATYAGTIKACEASLQRLRTDHLDAYLLHWREELPLADAFRAFDELVRQGKIRRWGVSNFDDADLAEALALVGPRRGDAQLVCNQVLYHLGERTIEHRVVPWCEQHGVAVVAYSPLGSRGGFPDSRALDGVARRLGATPRQVALAFLARRPSTLVIPKSSQARHVDELAGAVALDADAIAAIEAAFPLRPWRGLPHVMTRELDVVLFGATGFTGRLVADYLAGAAKREPLRWAIAGRSHDKLAALGSSLGPGVPIIVGDALDTAAMRALAQRTTAVCTTVGPFARYGSELVAACAAAGTHYCDLTGEVPWMRRMIDAHHERARSTGARIVHTCGFDSIPSDLGCWAAQQAFIARFGGPARRITAVFGEQSGGLSGGSFASAFEIAREADRDPAVRALLADPYALDPEPGAAAARPPAPDETSIGWQPALGMFTVPFVMAQVNTRVVRRGHALAGSPWGKDFVYREVMSTPGSLRGAAMAAGITGGLAALSLAMSQPWLRERLARRAPRPGEGPSAEARARGHWIARLVAEGDSGERLVYVASDRADPGYGSTSKMLGEAALCLARDPLSSPGGVLTPSVAMAQPLLDRLRRAGLSFAPA